MVNLRLLCLSKRSGRDGVEIMLGLGMTLFTLNFSRVSAKDGLYTFWLMFKHLMMTHGLYTSWLMFKHLMMIHGF